VIDSFVLRVPSLNRATRADILDTFSVVSMRAPRETIRPDVEKVSWGICAACHARVLLVRARNHYFFSPIYRKPFVPYQLPHG
jgi:hypothetical protein